MKADTVIAAVVWLSFFGAVLGAMPNGGTRR